MEEVDVLVVGQGLAGSWLSYWLQQAGIRFRIIDQPNPSGASRRAAGLINPVTGRRMVTTWMIDELMPFALSAYTEMEKLLQTTFFEETQVIDFFPSVQMLQAFEKRYQSDPAYLVSGEDREKYAGLFRYDLGWGAIQPCYLVRVEILLSAWRKWLTEKKLLDEAVFDVSGLKMKSTGIEYAGIDARYIVFCDGAAAAGSAYFEKLPFALNKGEGLLVEINNLPNHQVYKKGMSLVPYKDNIFWLGSSYEWSFQDELPSENFRIQADGWLKHFIKLPYSVLEHFAALRPATLERRPFVGFHPSHPQIGILNGLGTKGCSLAPYFAKQLVDKISGKANIDPLADIKRFEKVLGR